MRLIDADKLREKCDSPYWCVWLSEIDDTPTVEAVPVVHGEWIPYTISKLFSHTCSICHCDVEEKTPFCPHCGADMRISVK